MQDAAGPSRNVVKWFAAVLLFAALTIFLAILQGFQLTSESTARPALADSIASLTEIDAWLARNHDDLRARAEALEPGEDVDLREFPLQVRLTREEALELPREELRALLLERSVNAAYRQGEDAWREGGASSGAGRFTGAGAVEEGLGFLTEDAHDILGVLALVSVIACGLTAALLAAACRGFGRLASIGAVAFVASSALLLTGLLAWLSLGDVTGDDAEYVQRELLRVGKDLAWIPIRNGAALTALSAVVLGIGWAGARWADRRRPFEIHR